MIGSVKVIEAAYANEPMKVPIAILWPQKAPRNCEQAARDYTPSDEAASQSATNRFEPLHYPAAGLQSLQSIPSFSKGTFRHSKGSNKPNSFPLRLITVTLPTKRPGIFILVLKETMTLKAPIDRMVVLSQTMRQAHLPHANMMPYAS